MFWGDFAGERQGIDSSYMLKQLTYYKEIKITLKLL